MIRYFFKNAVLVALILPLLFVLNASAQLTGKIVDSKPRKPLDGVSIFINNTTIATSSDVTGQFNLNCPLTGFYDLVLYKPGYTVYRSSMKIQSGRLYSLNLTLAPAEKKKKTALTAEENKILRNSLTDASVSTTDVKILNEADIGMTRNDGHPVLICKGPLLVQNDATGYVLKYFISGLALSEISQAPVLVENLPTSDINQSIAWEKNRKKYFNGSLRHWLLAAMAGRLREEGFSCLDADGNEMDSKTFVSNSSIAGYKKINIPKPLTIHYKHDNVSDVSRLTIASPIDVSEAGVPINPKAVVAEGQLIKAGLADRLPVDYLPVAGNVDDAYSETMMHFYEKVYVHTDKPYYYPGETIWLKAYLNYYHKPWRDSLSRTLYVELIDPYKQKLMEKVLQIDSGTTNNDFILPDSVIEGNYYLRAYTNLNRNFGDSSLYVKVIPILNLRNGLDSVVTNDAKPDEYVTIISDKKKYNVREKITLSFEVNGKNGTPVNSNLSVSVTDAGQVVPILADQTIINSLQVGPIRKISKWQFNPENGIELRGRFLDTSGKPGKVPLNIIQTKPRKVFFAETNEQGIFSQSDLNFYDTVTFAFKLGKSKKYSFGKFELLPREIPPMSFRQSKFRLQAKTTQSREKIVAEYIAPNDSRMLEEVVVKARKIEEPVDRVRRPYGAPDATLTEKDFRSGYPNILYSLAGKVPGLMVDPASENIAFSRSLTQSVGNQTGPLVTIDDVPMGGQQSAGTILAMINPSSIESISFTKRLNVLYGSQGNAGVISVYLKKGASVSDVTPDFQSIKVCGYSSSHAFSSPNYGDGNPIKKDADYRATIYWNPHVKTSISNSKPVTFYAADLPGKYRVIVEGITEDGEPVRGEVYLEIDNE